MVNSSPSISSKLVSSLEEIAPHYDVFLVDVVGVVYDGVNAYPGAVSALNKLIRNKKTVVFLSNNPRPGDLLKEKLTQLGVEEPFQVFTSGDAVRLFLQKAPNKRIFHLGALRNQDILRGISVQTVEAVKDADLVLLSVFIEQNESLTQFDELLRTIANKKIPVFCANPDKIAVHGDTTRYCAGTFAEKLESFGGAVVYCGKPSYDFYSLFYENFLNDVPKEKILMIGDTLETDIKGAHNFQIDSLLVVTGNAEKMFEDLEVTSENTGVVLQKSPEKPTYVSKNL